MAGWVSSTAKDDSVGGDAYDEDRWDWLLRDADDLVDDLESREMVAPLP